MQSNSSYRSSQPRHDDSASGHKIPSQLWRKRDSLPLAPVVDGDMALVTVVRAVTPYIIRTAVLQDGLRSVKNYLAGESLRARFISRILHVAMTDTKLSSICVGRSSVNVVQSFVTVGQAGAECGPLAARGVIKFSKRTERSTN